MKKISKILRALFILTSFFSSLKPTIFFIDKFEDNLKYFSYLIISYSLIYNLLKCYSFISISKWTLLFVWYSLNPTIYVYPWFIISSKFNLKSLVHFNTGNSLTITVFYLFESNSTPPQTSYDVRSAFGVIYPVKFLYQGWIGGNS